MKRRLFITIAVMICSIVLLNISAFGLTVQPDYYYETKEEMMENYTFKLDGEQYKLPVENSKLIENGWQIDDGAFTPKELDSYTYASGFLKKADVELIVYYLNITDKTLPIEDCLLAGIEINDTDNIDFELENGMKIGTSLIDVFDHYDMYIEERETTSEDDLYTLYIGEQQYTMPGSQTGVELTFGYGEEYKQDHEYRDMNAPVGENRIKFYFDATVLDSTAKVKTIEILLLDFPEEED